MIAVGPLHLPAIKEEVGACEGGGGVVLATPESICG